MKYYIVTFILGIAFGLFVSFMHRTLINDASPLKPLSKITKELKKEVSQSEVSYSRTVDSLKKKKCKTSV